MKYVSILDIEFSSRSQNEDPSLEMLIQHVAGRGEVSGSFPTTCWGFSGEVCVALISKKQTICTKVKSHKDC